MGNRFALVGFIVATSMLIFAGVEPSRNILRFREYCWNGNQRSRNMRVLKLGEGLYRVESIGKLTLNGVTRIQNVTSQVTIGAYNLRATGNFEISQSNFDMVPANVAGGMLRLRDELKFAFFILARQDSMEDSQAQQTPVAQGSVNPSPCIAVRANSAAARMENT